MNFANRRLAAAVVLALGLGWYFQVEKPKEEAAARKVAEAVAQQQAALAQAEKDKAEVARLTEEKRKADAEKAEAARLAEIKRKADEEKAEALRLAEVQRKAEADKAEAARLAEAQRKADAEKAEAARLAEIQRKADEEKAEAARLAEVKRKAEEDKVEAARLVEEKRKADEQKIREGYEKNFGWLLGTWNVSSTWKVAMLVPKVTDNRGEKFVLAGSVIEGYEIKDAAVIAQETEAMNEGSRITGVAVNPDTLLVAQGVKPDLRGTILDSGQIKWESVSREPSGWCPIISWEMDTNQGTMKIVIDPTGKGSAKNPMALMFSRGALQSQPAAKRRSYF